MRTANISIDITSKTKFKHREWHIIPVGGNPNDFSIKTTTSIVVCELSFPKSCNMSFLNLIASAPELHDIVEMYHDHMLGGKMQKTMVFNMVSEVLQRLK